MATMEILVDEKWLLLKGKAIMWVRLILEGEIVGVQV